MEWEENSDKGPMSSPGVGTDARGNGRAQPDPFEDVVEGAAADFLESEDDHNKELGAAELAEKLAEAARAAEENRERYLRAQADLENLRRRTRLEKEELIQYAGERVISALLPVMDNLDRADQAARENADLEALLRGLKMIGRQLQDILSAEGLQPIEAVGKQFDPRYHEAVGQQESEDTPDNVIAQEYRKGYMLRNKVIRPAMVLVNRNSGSSREAE